MLDELIAALRSSANEKAKQAAEVLAKWDRSTEAASRGAILFLNFGARWMLGPGAHPFAVPWSAADPLGTPRQIADPSRAVTFLAQAAESTATRFGSIDVPWGEFNRFARDSVDLPGNGGPGELGIFRVIDFNPPLATHTRAGGGDSFIAAVEFSNPVQVRVLTTYGNSSQPGSPHRTDQLPFAARKEHRPAWRTRADVERHLEATDVLR
jgi:acyl-homoserine-lactone acylase